MMFLVMIKKLQKDFKDLSAQLLFRNEYLLGINYIMSTKACFYK